MVRGPPAHPFDASAPGLAVETADFRGQSRTGRTSGLGSDRGLAQQIHEPFAGGLTVHLLGAMFLREYEQNAILSQTAAREGLQTRLYLLGDGRRPAHIESQFDGRAGLVDVLPPRTAGARGALGDLALGGGEPPGISGAVSIHETRMIPRLDRWVMVDAARPG